jgi:hypothetical protein
LLSVVKKLEEEDQRKQNIVSEIKALTSKLIEEVQELRDENIRMKASKSGNRSEPVDSESNEVLLKQIHALKDRFQKKYDNFKFLKSVCGSQLGGIVKLLALVLDKVKDGEGDDNLIAMWSFLLSLTDECPENSRKFAENKGLDLFCICFQLFNENRVLVQYLLHVMANISEVEDLREKFKELQYVGKFAECLVQNPGEKTERHINYSAVNILTNLIADGNGLFKSPFTGSGLKERSILDTVERVMGSWALNEPLQLTFNSFKPFLAHLREETVPPESVHFSVHTLANRTRVDCAIYGPLLESEGGLDLLEKVSNRSDLPVHVQELALVTLLQVKKWKEKGSLEGLEDCPDLGLNQLRN